MLKPSGNGTLVGSSRGNRLGALLFAVVRITPLAPPRRESVQFAGFVAGEPLHSDAAGPYLPSRTEYGAAIAANQGAGVFGQRYASWQQSRQPARCSSFCANALKRRGGRRVKSQAQFAAFVAAWPLAPDTIVHVLSVLHRARSRKSHQARVLKPSGDGTLAGSTRGNRLGALRFSAHVRGAVRAGP